MSSSTTYRSVEALPEAVRAEIEAMLADHAPSSKLVPALVEDLIGRVQVATAAGTIPTADADTFVSRLASASTLTEVEATFESLPVGIVGLLDHGTVVESGQIIDIDAFVPHLETESSGLDAVIIGFPETQMPVRADHGDTGEPDATTARSVQWRLELLQTRLTIVDDDARVLGVFLDPDVERISEMLDAARVAASSTHPHLSDRHLDAAAAALDGLDERIEQAIIKLEERRHVTGQATRILESMGFRVDAGADGTALVAAGADGQRADARTETDASGVIRVTTTITDPAHAVPRDHADADQLCEPAVRTALAFHHAFESVDGFTLGRVGTPERPTRGQADAEATLHDPAEDPVTLSLRANSRKQQRRINK